MNRKFRKTALLMSVMALLGLGYSSNAYAAGDVQNVQQATKKVTGNVSDSQGPVIGASVVEKGTSNGVVTDSHDESVIGASVFEVGTRNGTVTDIDGKFSLTVSKGATLRISYIGYTTQEVKAQTNMKVVLEEERTDLNEVVVIGYGSVRRKDVTTAVSTVSTKDLETRPIVSAVSGMQGKAAGLQIKQANGQPGSSPTIRVRGTTSLNGSNNPLYVVDGVPLTDIDYLSASRMPLRLPSTVRVQPMASSSSAPSRARKVSPRLASTDMWA